jgi:hypothetical protein
MASICIYNRVVGISKLARLIDHAKRFQIQECAAEAPGSSLGSNVGQRAVLNRPRPAHRRALHPGDGGWCDRSALGDR